MREIILITDRRLKPIEEIWPWLPAAAASGLTALMVREKDLTGRPLLEMVNQAIGRCRPLGIDVIVNDRLDVALAAGAAGAHLGVAAIPVGEARRIAGRRLRIGASTHNLVELREAAVQGADYATFGPVFETPSKAAYGPPLGVAALREAAESVTLPVIALGGVRPDRASQLAGVPIAGVAAISAILLAEDPPGAIRQLGEALAAGAAP